MAPTRRQTFAMAGALPLLPLAHAALAKGPAPEVGEDGMHIQPWFHQSFLDLREDLAEAAASGRRLVVFWEQRGCPYCREMHAVNLADAEIIGFLKKHYVALQLNLYGSREVTDFDGARLEERRLAERWRVNFTPTLCFFPPTVAETKGKSGREAEAWRLMGYWKPFHFLGTLAYVQERGYASEPNFQRWLSGYADKLRAQGKEVKLW
jgi:thioredoxin-related protein